jgi:hypothetical protein
VKWGLWEFSTAGNLASPAPIEAFNTLTAQVSKSIVIRCRRLYIPSLIAENSKLQMRRGAVKRVRLQWNEEKPMTKRIIWAGLAILVEVQND